MKIKQYDRVLLKEGSEAVIVEILDADKVFIADIERNGDIDNDFLMIDAIEKVIE